MFKSFRLPIWKLFVACVVALSAISNPKPSTAEPGWVTAKDQECLYFTPDTHRWSITWSGGCNNGRLAGNGEIIWYDFGKYCCTGVGEFSEGTHFEGEITWSSGGRYIGSLVNDKFEGWAARYYANGARYEGYFRNGKRHGEGTMYYASGEIF